MLELKSYSKSELSEMFGSKSTQALERKMERYGIAFDKEGRGASAVYEIAKISNPFKVFCIVELGFDGGTDFAKLRNFYYYYFNDEEFMAMPDEVKEYRMWKTGYPVSRQTIANYVRRLEVNELISKNTNNFVYYFANKQTQRIVGKEEYCQAWKEYWQDIEDGHSSFDAIWDMRVKYGGVARKQPIPEINGIYYDKIECMLNYIGQSIENEMEG